MKLTPIVTQGNRSERLSCTIEHWRDRSLIVSLPISPPTSSADHAVICQRTVMCSRRLWSTCSRTAKSSEAPRHLRSVRRTRSSSFAAQSLMQSRQPGRRCTKGVLAGLDQSNAAEKVWPVSSSLPTRLEGGACTFVPLRPLTRRAKLIRAGHPTLTIWPARGDRGPALAAVAEQDRYRLIHDR